jgi:GH15 family glucan-1,4-alpha-glucosidase
VASGPIPQIQAYGVIGDCLSTALVSRFGSIDWLCWPRFDSPPVFAGLLDPAQGRWSIAPAGPFRVSRRYIADTPILETSFLTSSGEAVLTDLMPVASQEEKRTVLMAEHEILRKVECRQGCMDLCFSFVLPPGGRWERRHKHLGIRTRMNHGTLIVMSSIDVEVQGSGLQKAFTIREGETVYFSLSFSTEAPAVLPAFKSAEQTVARSIGYWEKFSSRINYQGPYREAVIRSALALKLMSHAPSGAIIAAPTTSLPEKIGAGLNWDYRYCWLRDASLTSQALMSLGLCDEARAFVDWLLHATNLTRPRLKVLYDVYGRKPPAEKTLDQLEGYFHSKPVRTGNQAAEQDQLDVYGEVICAAANIFADAERMDQETQKMLKEFGDYICGHWDQDDAGMWEVRGRREYFTHSLLLCWAGLKSLMELHGKGLIKKLPLEKIQSQHGIITQMLQTTAWNEPLQSFTGTLHGQGVDANLLLLPWYKCVAPDDPRMQSTYRRIKQELASSNGLLYRNHDQDEGVFLLCSLWAAEFLASGGGSLEEAEELFELVLSYANDVGLLSEEGDPSNGHQLGNFPLAFSHAGLINAAVAIAKREQEEGAGISSRKVHV